MTHSAKSIHATNLIPQKVHVFLGTCIPYTSGSPTLLTVVVHPRGTIVWVMTTHSDS